MANSNTATRKAANMLTKIQSDNAKDDALRLSAIIAADYGVAAPITETTEGYLIETEEYEAASGATVSAHQFLISQR